MPDSAQDKTEQATPERLQKARTEGQVVQSQEVASALITTGMIVGLVACGPQLLEWIRITVIEGLTAGTAGSGSTDRFGLFFGTKLREMFIQLLPIIGICTLTACFSSIAVTGLVFSPKALKFDLSKVHPVNGLKQLFSMQNLMKLLMGIVKLTLVSVVCWLYVSSRLDVIAELRWASPAEVLGGIVSLILGLMIRVCIALMVIAAGDWAFQKWNYKRRMKMTKQEVKEERRQHELPPEVRGKVRQLQNEMVRKRMMADVPTADVVVTNPTHVAVALKYDEASMDAPLCVAKGSDDVAVRIKEIAREHKVPIVERPVLARAINASVKVGEPIPSNLFVAVAEVLAMVFRMRRKKNNSTATG